MSSWNRTSPCLILLVFWGALSTLAISYEIQINVLMPRHGLNTLINITAKRNQIVLISCALKDSIAELDLKDFLLLAREFFILSFLSIFSELYENYFTSKNNTDQPHHLSLGLIFIKSKKALSINSLTLLLQKQLLFPNAFAHILCLQQLLTYICLAQSWQIFSNILLKSMSTSSIPDSEQAAQTFALLHRNALVELSVLSKRKPRPHQKGKNDDVQPQQDHVKI